MSTSELTPEQIEELKKRHIRSFVLRRGHISHAQQRALEEVFPRYELVYEQKPLDAAALFGREAPLVFEIGCGMGETTAAIAEAHPEINFLGCEVFGAGVGALSKLIEEKKLSNIRICRHDAIDVVRDMIPENSLAGVHIFFPDPWRKARHHKRRLSMKPGITGLWQVSGRSNIEDFEEVVRLDEQYIDNWTLWEDIRILFKTVWVVFAGKGAK